MITPMPSREELLLALADKLIAGNSDTRNQLPWYQVTYIVPAERFPIIRHIWVWSVPDFEEFRMEYLIRSEFEPDKEQFHKQRLEHLATFYCLLAIMTEEEIIEVYDAYIKEHEDIVKKRRNAYLQNDERFARHINHHPFKK